MEYTIKINDKKVYDSIVQFLKSLNINLTPEKNQEMDSVTMISEKSLGEEWNSKEDENWDKVL